MRVLAIYYEHEDDLPRCEQIDVSNERGIWKLSRLLSDGHVAELRIVGETAAAVGLARMLVKAGRHKRNAPSNRLRVPGDEAYPRQDPFIAICPIPEPVAFD